VYCIPVQCQYPAIHTDLGVGGGGLPSCIGAGGGPLTAMPTPAPALTPASTTHAQTSGIIAARATAARSFPMVDPETKPTIVYAGSDPTLPLLPD